MAKPEFKPDPYSADFNPAYATPEEVVAYTRTSRSEVERRLRDGTYQSFRSTPQRRLIVFASVLADQKRRIEAGADLGRHKGEGRGGKRERKPKDATTGVG
jgi:hypothetical protein